MSTTILTDEQKAQFVTDIADYGTGFVAPLFAVVEAIEQAVLQSPEIQAWKRDAELWRAMQEHSVVTFMNDYGRKLAIATVEIGRFPEKLALEQFVRAAMEKQS